MYKKAKINFNLLFHIMECLYSEHVSAPSEKKITCRAIKLILINSVQILLIQCNFLGHCVSMEKFFLDWLPSFSCFLTRYPKSSIL